MGSRARVAVLAAAETGRSRLTLVRGDITTQDTEAIVNAANSGLLGGGGVDGAIHRAGGPEILRACRAIREASGPCPPGHAVITGGGNLPARFVIHAVGPVWNGGAENEDAVLEQAYRACMALAQEHGITSVSFPSISTGAYRFPAERAAGIAFSTLLDEAGSAARSMEIRFVVFSARDESLYLSLFDGHQILTKSHQP